MIIDTIGNIIFTPERAREIIWEDDAEFRVVEDTITSNSRWHINHVAIVTKDNQSYYELAYQVGATEMQDHSPFEYEDKVTAHLVIPEQVTKIVWKRMKNTITYEGSECQPKQKSPSPMAPPMSLVNQPTPSISKASLSPKLPKAI